jgi:hypothetical protein
MTDKPFDFGTFEPDDTTAEDMTAKANEFWERPMFSPEELAQMDETARAFCALVHPPHPTMQ